MATRTATLDYRTTGAGQATGDVVKLSDALDRQRQRAAALGPDLQKLAAQHGIFGTVTRAAAEDVTRLASGLGPLAVAASQVAARSLEAAGGLTALAGGAERATAASRLLNTTALVGVSAMVAGGAAAVAYAHRLLEQADAYTTLHAKVQIYTKSVMEAAEVERNIFSGAREARTSVESEGRLFSRLAPAVQDAGRTPEDAVKIATLVSKAMTIQGATGQEATYGAIDLIHALSTGQLQGRQLRGLETEAPVLARYIAENLQGPGGKIGVPYGALREMAAKGGINSNMVIEALMRAQPQIEADFAKAPKTASQGWQILNDKIMQTVGQLATVSGAQKGVFDWLSRLTDQADKFREKLLLDPNAAKDIQGVGAFVGEALGGLGALGSVVVDNFDKIVAAGQLIIALKLGEVIATWFGNAATTSKAFLSDLSTFAARAKEAAGAQAAPVAAQAALAAKASAATLSARATDLAAQADVKAATAAAARTAADNATAKAEALRAAEERSLANAAAINSAKTSAALVDEAAAQRRLGEAAAERAVLEEEAARRSAAAATSRAAGQDATALSAGGVGPAGRLYGAQALRDATEAMRLSDAEIAVRIERLKAIEIAEAAAANTTVSSAARRAAAEQAAGAQIAQAETLAAQAREAEAAAATQEALAERLETQASAAATAAAGAQTAAVAREAVAMEAAAAVTAEVTLAQTALTVATTALDAAYAALGGPIGVATIVIGGLIYALWQAHEAHQAEITALRDQVVITDKLTSLIQAMTSATWSQIPALQARAKALRDNAAAAQLKNQAELKTAKADLDQLRAQQNSPLTAPRSAEEAAALAGAIDAAEQRVKDLGGILAAGQADAANQKVQAFTEAVTVYGKITERLANEIRSGKNERGDALTPEQIARDRQQLAYNRTQAQGAFDRANAGWEAANNAGAKELWAQARDAAVSAIHAADADPTPVVLDGKHKKPHARGEVDTALRQTLRELEQQSTWSPDMQALAASQHSFSASPSQRTVFDTTTGKPFVAIGPDQARAAQQYLDAVREIEKATPQELAKFAPGQSKADLLAAAQAAFQYALASSQAAKADDAWAKLQQRLGLATEQETTRVRQLTAALEERKRKGLDRPADADQMLARAALLDRADQQRKSINQVRPIWDQFFSDALSSRPRVPRLGNGDFDVAAEQQRIMQAQAEADARTIAQIRKDADEKGALADADQRKQIEKEAADEIAAIDIASRTRTNVELSRIERDAAENRVQREQEITDRIAGDFKRAFLSGNFSDLGSAIGNEFLSALYDELLANPIHDMIRGVVHDLLSGIGLGGGGGGIGWGQGADWTLPSIFGGGGGGGGGTLSSVISTAENWIPSIFADGRVPGYANGRLERGFIYRGRGGPRDDANLIRISDQEGIINAHSTRKYAPILDLINRDALPGFAGGYVPSYGGGGRGAGGLTVSINNQGTAKSATVSQDAQGGVAINLYDAVGKPAIRQAGRDGTLYRSLSEAPDPVKRRA